MNPVIKIAVRERVATVVGAPVIICGNRDYTVTFDLDDEWSSYELKTARFVYAKDGELVFTEKTFSGLSVTAPILINVKEVHVGLYAGETYITTPARIPCTRSILCDNPDPHEPPEPDVYQQLLAAINALETLPHPTSAEAGMMLKINERGEWATFIHDFATNQELSETEERLSDSINATEQALSGVSNRLQSVETSFLNKTYPLGSIYITTHANNPAQFFGGTWEAIHDCFLLAGGTYTYPFGSTGGEATHTLTLDEIPSHNHGVSAQAYAASGSATYGGTLKAGAYTTEYAYTSEQGGGQAHNNMPPYLSVHMWKRVA